MVKVAEGLGNRQWLGILFVPCKLDRFSVSVHGFEVLILRVVWFRFRASGFHRFMAMEAQHCTLNPEPSFGVVSKFWVS